MSSFALLLTELTAELALFAAAGFFLFAIDDLIVDLIYFLRAGWRSAAVYSRFPRAFAGTLAGPAHPGWLAVFIPAWDESAVIAPMLRTTLQRFDHDDYRLFIGHYRNDPATQAAIDSVRDPRVVAVEVDVDGPTTKADCLNRLFESLTAYEATVESQAKAIVLHDAEDVVHPLELKLFDRLVERAGAVQLPVVPLIDPDSRWVAGHYADEFAESHMKELVVRSLRRPLREGRRGRPSIQHADTKELEAKPQREVTDHSALEMSLSCRDRIPAMRFSDSSL